MRRAERPQERGAALLTVLLLVAVIAVLAGTALEKLRLATRVGGNAVALDQARAFSFAAETLAVARISALLARSPERVTLAGGWSGTPIPLPIPGGSATATIVDGGNCFNLNSLVDEDRATGTYGAYTTTRNRFARLIRLVAPDAAPEAIAAAASDWIDSDSDPIGQGAEDGSYQGYRPANTLMADPSELRAVSGVTPALYTKLRPWLCTLPTTASARINVDTLLPERAPLIAMLMLDRPSVEAARQALLRRPPQGFATADEFWNSAALRDGQHETDATSVRTAWFALKVDVALGGTNLEQNGLIDASTLPARLVSRQWGEPS